MLLSQELLHLREAYRSFRKKVVSLQNEVDSLHRILLFLFCFLGVFLVAGGGDGVDVKRKEIGVEKVN